MAYLYFMQTKRHGFFVSSRVITCTRSGKAASTSRAAYLSCREQRCCIARAACTRCHCAAAPCYPLWRLSSAGPFPRHAFSRRNSVCWRLRLRARAVTSSIFALRCASLSLHTAALARFSLISHRTLALPHETRASNSGDERGRGAKPGWRRLHRRGRAKPRSAKVSLCRIARYMGLLKHSLLPAASPLLA